MLRKLWSHSPPLMATCFLMLAAFFGALLGVFLDPRLITGAPAWLKPAKFGISTAIYTATLAWVFGQITVWPRFKRAMGTTICAIVILEVVIIDIQAARGVPSHFNESTPLNAALFAIMGSAIAVLWLASIGVLIVLFRQRFTDPAWGWALRTGMLISIIGAAAGGLMVRPTPAQIESLAHHQDVAAIGGHTVGGVDGGAGLPGVGWSKRHGDLRIPHFFGLHALQIIRLAAWLIGRRRTPAGILAVAGGYSALLALLTWQALHGLPLLG